MIDIVAGINSQDSSPKDGLLGWIRARRTKMAIEPRAKSRSWVQLYSSADGRYYDLMLPRYLTTV